MNARFMRSLAVLTLLTGLAGCGSMGGLGGATSLFDQLGGKDAVKSLADSFVNNVASDSRTSSMLSGANVGSLKSKTSDQFCALAGGGCPAPLSSGQITEAGKKVNPRDQQRPERQPQQGARLDQGLAPREGERDEAPGTAAGRHRRRALVVSP